VRNPFQGQKKAHFTKVVKPDAATAATASSLARIGGDDPEEDTLQSVEDEFAAAVAELASLDPSSSTSGQSDRDQLFPSRAPRRPFTTKIGVGLGFKPSPHSQAAWRGGAQTQTPEPATLEEYLAQKKAKKAAEQAAATVASKQKQPVQRHATMEEKEHTPTSPTFLTEAGGADAPPAPAPAPKLVIHVPGDTDTRRPLPPKKQFRRVLETRMLVADGMAGNEAALFDIRMVRAAGTHMQRWEKGPPSLWEPHMLILLLG
jgi:hypothetical protein